LAAAAWDPHVKVVPILVLCVHGQLLPLPLRTSRSSDAGGWRIKPRGRRCS
jgi:hypothetical protein